MSAFISAALLLLSSPDSGASLDRFCFAVPVPENCGNNAREPATPEILMRALSWLLAWGAAATALPVAAQNGTSDKQLSLTIYNDDLALVEHVRQINVDAGRQRIEFEGVSAQIMSQTVSMGGAGLDILEQNFDYDLLTPGKLIEKAVGQTITIVRTNPANGEEIRETAEVLSTTGGTVLRIGDRIEVLREDGLPTRVIFDEVPPNLRARPTLSVLVDAKDDFSGDVTIAYLTSGLSWNADYVALFDEAAGALSIQGWITLENTSGTSFENAHTQLVAGAVNMVASPQQWWERYSSRYRPSTTSRRTVGTESSNREQLSDLYVYPVAGTTNIDNNQTNHVSFLNEEKVSAIKAYDQTFYFMESFESAISAEVRVRIAN
jgi:hypothetical protein